MAIRPDEAIKPLTVLELNGRIHDLLAARFQSVFVKGEVSGVSPRSGHIWFTLKDASAAIGAVVFSGTARRMPFLPENGQELVVTGQVDYHALSGRVNLVVTKLDYDGAGKLREAIEVLKRRLQAEGVFALDRKRPLPFLPRCVALVTSPSGAVIHDLQQTIWERFPNVPLVVYAALVQGVASQRSLVAALRQCDRDGVADVCIVARGGGSFEELMAFNQEPVVRAIQAMRIPVITALGHTSDRTLADLAADKEARTPTAAAELVVPKKSDLLRQLGDRGQRLQRAGRTVLIGPGHQLEARRRTLERLTRDTAERRREKLANLVRLLRSAQPRGGVAWTRAGAQGMPSAPGARHRVDEPPDRYRPGARGGRACAAVDDDRPRPAGLPPRPREPRGAAPRARSGTDPGSGLQHLPGRR